MEVDNHVTNLKVYALGKRRIFNNQNGVVFFVEFLHYALFIVGRSYEYAFFKSGVLRENFLYLIENEFVFFEFVVEENKHALILMTLDNLSRFLNLVVKFALFLANGNEHIVGKSVQNFSELTLIIAVIVRFSKILLVVRMVKDTAYQKFRFGVVEFGVTFIRLHVSVNAELFTLALNGVRSGKVVEVYLNRFILYDTAKRYHALFIRVVKVEVFNVLLFGNFCRTSYHYRTEQAVVIFVGNTLVNRALKFSMFFVALIQETVDYISSFTLVLAQKFRYRYSVLLA